VREEDPVDVYQKPRRDALLSAFSLFRFAKLIFHKTDYHRFTTICSHLYADYLGCGKTTRVFVLFQISTVLEEARDVGLDHLQVCVLIIYIYDAVFSRVSVGWQIG
jgi:hypothetical protein